MPLLQSLYEKYRDAGLVVLGLSVRNRADVTKALLAECGVRYPCVIDTSDEAIRMVYENYYAVPGLSAVPISYLIDRKGVIRRGWIGSHKEEHVDLIEELLRE